ncbi:MAG TPA: site-2 protease family protein [Candidatus Woesebacteria bacterium]|nr:site-2 protease family protein [Candidatus Woesebacteria bacterium]
MTTIFSLIALVIAITIHEFAHALVADRLGDPTPRSQGRLTLNPLAHLDPLGTLMLLIAHFGWGKPVQIDPYNFSHPKRDELLVALAGPTSNIFLAIVTGLLIRFFPNNPLISLYVVFLITNLSLAIFNLIPIPPLDGSKILINLLPSHLSVELSESFDKFGIVLLIIFLFLPFNGSSLVSHLMTPIINFCLRYLLLGH